MLSPKLVCGAQTTMGDKLIHALFLENGGIQRGSQVEYYAKVEENKVDFRAKQSGSVNVGADEFDEEEVKDENMYA
jgi:hypothetical protein